LAEVFADNVSLVNNTNGPFVVISNRTIIDTLPGCNNNGRFDPGETGLLTIALRNVGNQTAFNINAVLRSGDSRFEIIDSSADFGDIQACSTCINTNDGFVISVSPLIPMETSIPCNLFINGDSICDTFAFHIVIGEIRTCDPIPDGPRQPPLYWAYDDVDTFYIHHPLFEWVECYGAGTQLILGDDQTQTINLPAGFVWNYYGQGFNQISICSNGWVAPGSTTNQIYLNTGLPSASAPAGMVAVNWDDLDPQTGPGVWYYYEPMKHCFVVEWDSVPYYGTSTPEKFQVVIFDTTVHSPTGNNIITMQYATGNGFTSSTIGIQDYSLMIGIQCLFDSACHRGTAPIVAGRAVRFLTADPTVGIEPIPPAGANSKSEFSVSAAPNPFRNRVTFNLNRTLNPKSNARIYDNTGRIVRSLLTGSNTALTWDGRDNELNEVRAGVYFLRVDNIDNHAMTKLILTR
jgi:hypothetical protein